MAVRFVRWWIEQMFHWYVRMPLRWYLGIRVDSAADQLSSLFWGTPVRDGKFVMPPNAQTTFMLEIRPSQGEVRYNDDLGRYEVYEGTVWHELLLDEGNMRPEVLQSYHRAKREHDPPVQVTIAGSIVMLPDNCTPEQWTATRDKIREQEEVKRYVESCLESIRSEGDSMEEEMRWNEERQRYTRGA